jgi:hypothetical protein
VTALLWAVPSQAKADTCVALDTGRDGLSHDEQQAARVLFEEALAQAGHSVTGADCSETWTLYHVKMGDSVTVVAKGPYGTQKRRVSAIEELPAVYDQMAKSLTQGSPATNDSEAMSRDTVTASQTKPQRVKADHMWYVKLGFVGGSADRVHTGPLFGFGTRWELDRFALDVSFLTFALLDQGSGEDSGVSGEFIGLSGHYFFNPSANHTPYVGLGVGYGGQSLPAGFDGSGLHGKVAAGYELFRASSIRAFAQLDLTLPFYLTHDETESRDEDHYVPTLGLSVGAGWGS